jgi:hypothetical protein
MGNKSYWFEGDQKGNFSNNGKDTFDPKKSYTGIRLQQGVPLLDRDWNELEDIRRYQEMMLRRTYLGNGTPDDGFRISACNPAGMDFQISYGRFLVDGLEAVNWPNEYNSFSKYTAQKDEPALKTLSDNESGVFYYTVYLDLWIDEITGVEDSALNNKDDVKICTSVRHRIQWRVKVKEWVYPDEPKIDTLAGHHYIKLAKIKRSTKGITDNDITDIRSTWQSLESTEQRFRSIINELLRGNIPSESTRRLTPNGIELIQIIEDSQKNAYVFFNAGTTTLFYTLLNEGKWNRNVIHSTNKIKRDNTVVYSDTVGNIWLFWIQIDSTMPGSTAIPKTSIKSLRFTSGISDGDPKLVVSGASLSAQNLISDSIGNIIAFWIEEIGAGKIALSYKACSAKSGTWEEHTHLATELFEPIKKDEKLRILRDHKDTIYLFWIASDSYNSICHTRSIKKGRQWSTVNRISLKDTGQKSNLRAAIDKDGKICFFWIQHEKSHKIGEDFIYTTRWDPANDKSDVASKVDDVLDSADTLKIVIDGKGRIWLFWKRTLSGGIFYKNSDNWSKAPLALTECDTGCYSVFIDAQDVLWVLFQKEASKNIWCKRFINGEWMNEMRLLGDETAKIRIDMLDGHHGDNWLFWQDMDSKNAADKSGNIWCKRCYGAL